MTERDLDLIVLEELHSDTGFAAWIGARIGLTDARLIRAEQSVSAKVNARWGETDILAFLADDSGTVALLIEDKIAAEFQPDQAVRYHERAQALVETGAADRAVTMLCAPADYLAAVPDGEWQAHLSLEEMATWFDRQGTSHGAWRAGALHSCLARVRSVRTASEAESRWFSKELRAYLHGLGDGFDHTVTGDVSWLFIRFDGKPAHMNIAWRTRRALVELSLSEFQVGRAEGIPIPPGVAVSLASESGRSIDTFALEVPMLDVTRSPAEQEEDMAQVVEAVRMLRTLARAILGDLERV